MFVEFILITAPFLGMVHGDVCAFDQRFCILTVVGIHADTDAHADVEFVWPDMMRPHLRGQHLFRRNRSVLCVLNIGKQHHEFITALAANGI